MFRAAGLWPLRARASALTLGSLCLSCLPIAPPHFRTARAPTLSRYIVDMAGDNQTAATRIVLFGNAVLPSPEQSQALLVRLPILESKALLRAHVFAQLAAVPNADGASILAAIINEASVFSKTGSSDGVSGGNPAIPVVGSTPSAIRDGQLEAVFMSSAFRRAMMSISVRDLTLTVPRREVIADALTSGSGLFARALFDETESLARRHPTLGIVYGVRGELGAYYAYTQCVDIVTGLVPQRLSEWTQKSPDSDRSPWLVDWCRLNIATMDQFNGDYGILALHKMQYGSHPAPIHTLDFYCTTDNVRLYGAWTHRNLVAMGASDVLPPGNAGFTMTSWCEFYITVIEKAYGLRTLKEQVCWLYYATTQFVAFLVIVAATLERFVHAPDPATAELDAIAPLDCQPALNLRNRVAELGRLLDNQSFFDWLKPPGAASSLSISSLPLISANRGLIKELGGGKDPVVGDGGAGGKKGNKRQKVAGKGKKPSGGGDVEGGGGKPVGSASPFKTPWGVALPGGEYLISNRVWSWGQMGKDLKFDPDKHCPATNLTACVNEKSILLACKKSCGAHPDPLHKDLKTAMHAKIVGVNVQNTAFRNKYSRPPTKEETAKLMTVGKPTDYGEGPKNAKQKQPNFRQPTKKK